MKAAVEFSDAVNEFQQVALPRTYQPVPPVPVPTDIAAVPGIGADAAKYKAEREAARDTHLAALDSWLQAESLRTAPGYFGATPSVLTPTRAPTVKKDSALETIFTE